MLSKLSFVDLSIARDVERLKASVERVLCPRVDCVGTVCCWVGISESVFTVLRCGAGVEGFRF